MGVTPINRLAPDVGCLPIVFVNAYFLGRPGGRWVLVDTGIPGSMEKIQRAAVERFGERSRPEAILLTHGHFDHAGSALELAEEWDVPIHAHALEFPYLTGKSSYPPPDPTIGGAIAFLSRFMPSRPLDFRGRLRPLHEGDLEMLPGWDCIDTPGHSPGHVSFFQREDGMLVAGDAFATMDMDSWIELIAKTPELKRAGAPFNFDWSATAASVRKLAALRPKVAACGHGIPINDNNLPARMQGFAASFDPPQHGRYVASPAVTDETGIVSLPPAPFDPVLAAAAVGLFAVGLTMGAGFLEDDR